MVRICEPTVAEAARIPGSMVRNLFDDRQELYLTAEYLTAEADDNRTNCLHTIRPLDSSEPQW